MQDVIIEDNDKDLNVKGIMTGEEVKVSVTQFKMRALQENFCSASVEFYC